MRKYCKVLLFFNQYIVLCIDTRECPLGFEPQPGPTKRIKRVIVKGHFIIKRQTFLWSQARPQIGIARSYDINVQLERINNQISWSIVVQTVEMRDWSRYFKQILWNSKRDLEAGTSNITFCRILQT